MEALKLNSDEVTKVNEILTNLRNSVNPSLSDRENMVEFYLSQREGVYREDAEADVDKIIHGVTEFNKTFNEAMNAESVDYTSLLKEKTANLTLEEQYSIYVNTLAAIRAIEADVVNQTKGEFFAEFKENTYVAVDGITQEMIDDLLSEVNKAFTDSGMALVNAETINGLLNAVSHDENIVDFLNENYDDDQTKYFMALAMYIAYLSNLLPSFPEGLTPEMIAVAAASGIETNKVAIDVATGRKPLDVALKIFKIIAGTALIVLLILSLAVVGAIVATALFYFFSAIFGAGLISTALAMGLVIAVLCYSDSILEGAMATICKLGDVFDKTVEDLRATAFPAIQKKVKDFFNWLNEIINRGIVQHEQSDFTENQIVANA